MASVERANALRLRLRNEPLSASEWRTLVDAEVSSTYLAKDLQGFAAVVSVIVNQLDSRGRYDEALAELSLAETVASDEPEALAIVLGLKATMLFTRGKVAQSRAVADQVDDIAGALKPGFARSRGESASAIVRMVTMDEDAAAAAEALLRPTGDLDVNERLFVGSWHIPYLFAVGRRLDARPWARTFRVVAEEQRHAWRSADAAIFEAADAWLDGRDTSASAGINTTAAIRLAVSDLHRGLQSQDWDVAGEALRRLTSISFDPAFFGPPNNFEAITCVRRDGVLSVTPCLPSELQLANWPAMLAGAEAVGTAGSQADAGEWLRWWRAHVPRFVRTSLEWPAAASRIEALLELRAGELRAAKPHLEQAAEWADSSGYTVEANLAKIQLAELCSFGDFLVPEQSVARARKDAWHGLREAGIDPAPHVYAVARSAPMVQHRRGVSRLTPREVEVLALLGDGLTYRAIAERLGITWPTVQTLSHRIYEKLEASGRMAALQRARDIGIL